MRIFFQVFSIIKGFILFKYLFTVTSFFSRTFIMGEFLSLNFIMRQFSNASIFYCVNFQKSRFSKVSTFKSVNFYKCPIKVFLMDHGHQRDRTTGLTLLLFDALVLYLYFIHLSWVYYAWMNKLPFQWPYVEFSNE